MLAHPEILIQAGNRRMRARAEGLPADRAAQVMVDYSRNHRALWPILARILGYATDGSEADARYFGTLMPMMNLMPDGSQK